MNKPSGKWDNESGNADDYYINMDILKTFVILVELALELACYGEN